MWIGLKYYYNLNELKNVKCVALFNLEMWIKWRFLNSVSFALPFELKKKHM